MNDAQDSRDAAAESARFEPLLKADLESLRQVSARSLPDLSTTAEMLRERSQQLSKEGFWMRNWRGMVARPGRFSALAGVGLAAVLIAVPVSFQRTVGYEARLRISSPPSAGSIQALALQWKGLLRADAVEVRAEADRGLTLVARLPRQPLGILQSRCLGFARGLADRGIQASATVSPRVEQVLGNVYALAAERLQEIRINGQGRTTAQIEQEIRERLTALGAVNPQVTVTRTGKDTRISIQADASGSGKRQEQRVTLSDDAAAPASK